MVRLTLLAHRSNYGAKRNTSKIKYIVVHYTANDGDSARGNARYFQNNVVKASAHYFVDDTTIYQSVPDDYVAYSVGGSRYSDYKKTGGAKLYRKVSNANSISIEMCDTSKNGSVMASSITQENTLKLIRELMAKYNIPVERVIRHFDVNGKHCPAYFIGDNEWLAFRNRINGSNTSTSGDLDYSLVFNADYYRSRYSDLRAAGLTSDAQLLNHFINHGMNECRQGIDTFDVVIYRARYADLLAAFGEDFPAYYRHYIQFGHAEGRKAV